jgi:mono/diheme cytochrome c family protein
MPPYQAVLLAAIAAAGAAVAKPVDYTTPPETATLPTAAGVEAAQANCSGCHSVDYITTQPRTFKDQRAFWVGEVAKMKKAYGAPIQDQDIPTIVDYLTAMSKR